MRTKDAVVYSDVAREGGGGATFPSSPSPNNFCIKDFFTSLCFFIEFKNANLTEIHSSSGTPYCLF